MKRVNFLVTLRPPGKLLLLLASRGRFVYSTKTMSGLARKTLRTMLKLKFRDQLIDLLFSYFQMNRATCVLVFYLIGGTVAISFLIPDMLAQKNLDTGLLENAKVAIYLVDSIEIHQ